MPQSDRTKWQRFWWYEHRDATRQQSHRLLVLATIKQIPTLRLTLGELILELQHSQTLSLHPCYTHKTHRQEFFL